MAVRGRPSRWAIPPGGRGLLRSRTVSTALAISLAIVLLWAGLAKLRRPAAFTAGLAQFGVAPRLRVPLGGSIIAAEIGLAILLALGITTRLAGALAAALLVAFALALVVAGRRGSGRVTCRCFGGSRPADGRILAARSLLLAALAAAVALAPSWPDPTLAGGLVAAVAILTVAVAGLAVLVLALYRQVGVLSQRLGPRLALELAEEGPPLGAAAPALAGPAGAGLELVAFMSRGCRLCGELAPGLRALEREGLPVVVARETDDPAAFERWNIPGTPFVAVLVDGVVRAKGLVNSLEQLDQLLAVGSERHREALALV